MPEPAPALVTDGPIFTRFRNSQANYMQETEVCSRNAVAGLLAHTTATNRPGMLLGQIQSGKTRAFIGAIAIGFDNGFDAAIVFTKGTKALTRQTVARLSKDLNQSVQDELLLVFDIRSLPSNLSDWELARKLVIVCKKEDDNLAALYEAFTDTYPELAERRVMVIDDEADFASIGYRRTAGVVEANVIPTQIDDLRQQLAQAVYLQVTATPYSLYLQPEDAETAERVFYPVRPAFTEIVPVHPGYIGGHCYFEESLNDDSVAAHLHVEVQDQELRVLKRNDHSLALHEVLTSPLIPELRRAIVTFVVGAWIRRHQQSSQQEPRRRYSFIVHTETGRAAHDWQAAVVGALVDQLRTAAAGEPHLIQPLISDALADLAPSLEKGGLAIPALDDVMGDLATALQGVMVTTVNSEKQIEELLDDDGQLKLRNPFNVFIGGQILDRGLTIDNLIGFFYGRSPRKKQQDTVLQHARMYGNRAPADLAVTRFYTTDSIYQAMRTIYEFDTALRTSIQAGGAQHGVAFLRADTTGTVVPCSPNKVLLSGVTTLRNDKRLIPVGFHTTADADDATAAVDELLATVIPPDQLTAVVPLGTAEQLLDRIADSIVMDSDRNWLQPMKASVAYLATARQDGAPEVAILVRRDRNDRKVRADGRLQNAPESSGDDAAIDQIRGTRPALLLYRENGSPDRGWTGTAFWWPVLQAPANTRAVVFASEALS